MVCIWTIFIVFSVIVIYLLLDWLIRLPKIGNFTQKYVFITGCDSGFGKHLAIRLDKMGFRVFAGCLTNTGADILTETCSSRLVTIKLDVTDDKSIQAARDFVRQSLPSDTALWAVVNNAGVVGHMATAEMTNRRAFLDTCAINLFGPMEISRMFMPFLRKSQGRLVNITSMLGRFAGVNATYSVSKFGLEGYCDIIRREVAPFGVKVCIIEPGFCRTPLTDPNNLKSLCKQSYEATEPDVRDAYGPDFLKNQYEIMDAVGRFTSPDYYKVVEAYVAAITSKYPRARYVVGFDAKFFYIPLSFMPEWVGDYACKKRIEWFMKKE